MLKRPNMGRITAGRAVLVAAIAVVPMAVALAAGSGEKEKPQPPSVEKAELMGRVAWTMMHGGRDITAVKPIEWGDPQTDEKGNRSIRCKYYATIWDREVLIMNSVFTFDAKGYPVSMKHVEGFPKPYVKRKFDTTTKNGMIELVQDFFTKNFRDVTSRNTIEWGEPEKGENGNVSIRYKYEATIWDKDVKIMNQVFTFGPDGKFVDYKNVEGFPKDKEVSSKGEPETGVMPIYLDKDGNVGLDAKIDIHKDGHASFSGKFEMNKDGSATLGDKNASEEQLVKELKRYAAGATKDSMILVKADSRCPYKKVAHVLKLCQAAGITRTAIAVVHADSPVKAHSLPVGEGAYGR